MRLARKFAAYSARERRLVLKAWCIVSAIRVLLWTVPYRWVEQWCLRAGTPTAGGAQPAEIALSVTRASTLVPVATCLVQALAGAWLIRRAGGDAVIHFGVAREAAAVKAHAWLESEGRILIGGGTAADYLPLTPADDVRR